MRSSDQPRDESVRVAESIGRMLRDLHQTVAAAESLTSGDLATHLGVAEASSEWFKGAVVAYAAEVKFTVLGVDRGPVVTASCAQQMAQGVARLMDSDFAVALTGVGGPTEEEGQPVGTVFFAVHSLSGDRVDEQHFAGDAQQVIGDATLHALQMLEAEIREAPGS